MAKHPTNTAVLPNGVLSQRLKSALLVAPRASGATGHKDVIVKLQHRKKVSKLIYNRTAKEIVKMKPLTGDRTGIWWRGMCLQKVAPQSYLVEFESSFYHRKHVELRMAEPIPEGWVRGAFNRMQWV